MYYYNYKMGVSRIRACLVNYTVRYTKYKPIININKKIITT